MYKETTSTNPEIGDEEYKGLDLLKICKIDTRAFGNTVKNLTHQELLAVIMSGDHKEALDTTLNVLNTCFSHVIHLCCASLNQAIKVEGIRFGEPHHIKACKATTRIAGPLLYLLSRSRAVPKQWTAVNTLTGMDVVS